MCKKKVIYIDTDNEALNENSELENTESTTPVEEQTAEEVETEVEEGAPEATEEPTETEDESKKGYNARVRELANKKREAERRAALAEERANSLEGRLNQLTGQDDQAVIPQIPTVQDEPLIKPGEEIDAMEFERRLKLREENNLKKIDAMVQLRTKQAEAVQKIANETREVVAKFPELDPTSDVFNKDLSDTVAEATEAYIKNNPYSGSVKKFVERLMKPYQGAVTKEVGKVQETLAKQVSQAAIRPSSYKAKEKPATEKTIAELEEELGVVQS